MKSIEFYFNEMRNQSWWVLQNQSDKTLYFIKAAEVQDNLMVAISDFVNIWLAAEPKSKILADIYSQNSYLNIEGESEKVMLGLVLECMRAPTLCCQYEITPWKKNSLSMKVTKKVEFFSLHWTFLFNKIPREQAERLLQAYLMPSLLKMSHLVPLEITKTRSINNIGEEVTHTDINQFNQCANLINKPLFDDGFSTEEIKKAQRNLFINKMKSNSHTSTKTHSEIEELKDKKIKARKQGFL